MSTKINEKTRKMTGLAVLTAVVIVLQVFTTFVHFGPFSITLALIPIVIGAAMYGALAGAYLGAVFSVIVVIMCITGGDPGGFMVWAANPFMCVVMCMLKGTLAGLAAGLAFKAFENTNQLVGTILAALVSPVVNTGLFIVGMLLFFKDTLAAWAGGSNLFTYIIFGLTGVNFLIELAVNMILSPVVLRIVNAVKNH